MNLAEASGIYSWDCVCGVCAGMCPCVCIIACMCVCICARAWARVHACVGAHNPICVGAQVRTRLKVRACAYVRVCVC